jgi:hypothetical protein
MSHPISNRHNREPRETFPGGSNHSLKGSAGGLPFDANKADRREPLRQRASLRLKAGIRHHARPERRSHFATAEPLHWTVFADIMSGPLPAMCRVYL